MSSTATIVEIKARHFACREQELPFEKNTSHQYLPDFPPYPGQRSVASTATYCTDNRSKKISKRFFERNWGWDARIYSSGLCPKKKKKTINFSRMIVQMTLLPDFNCWWRNIRFSIPTWPLLSMPSQILNPVIKAWLSCETPHLHITQPLAKNLGTRRAEYQDEGCCSDPGLRSYSTRYVFTFWFLSTRRIRNNATTSWHRYILIFVSIFLALTSLLTFSGR